MPRNSAENLSGKRILLARAAVARDTLPAGLGARGAHVDVAAAYRWLVETGVPGEIYNLADDHPAPLGDIVRAQAIALGAPPPLAVPGFVIRLVGGPLSGSPALANAALSNRKLKALGFSCKYPGYEQGVVALAKSLKP